MADVNIVGNVSIKTADAAEQVLKLKTKVSELKEAFNNAEKGSDSQKTALIELTKAQQDLSSANGKLNSSLEENGGAFDVLKGKIQGMVPGLKGAEGGVQSFGAELKVLMANPIILMLTGIVVALGLLYEAFAGSVEGGKQLKQVWAGLQAVGQQLIDAWMAMARAVIDVYVAVYKFITLDFKGSMKSFSDASGEAKNSMRELGNATGETYNKFMMLEKAQQANDLARKKSAVVISETNKLLVQSREILTDENATIEEKKKALAEVTAAETKSSAERVRIANEDLRIIKAKQEAFGLESENAKKLNQEVRELTIAANEAAQENAQTEVKLNKQKKMLEKQQKAEEAAADKEEKDRIKAAKEKAKAERDNQKAFADKDAKLRMEANLALMKDGAEKEIQIVNNKLADEKAANQRALEDGKITKAQMVTLNSDAQRLAGIEVGNINKKYREKEKEEARKFQEELNKLELDLKLSGITDAREKERVALERTYEERFKQAAEKYKGNEERLKQVQAILIQEKELAKKILEKKFADEDDKEEYSFSLKRISRKMVDAKMDFNLQKKLVDDKRQLMNSYYKNELIAAQGNAKKLREVEEKHHATTR